MGCSSSCGSVEALESEVVVASQVQTAWSRLGGDELEGPIRDGLVALVRADWLVQRAETGGKLQRRQDLPEDAFVSLEELKAAGSGGITEPVMSINWEWLRVIVLSYPWLQPGHPDPYGQNLRLIAKALKAFVQDSAWNVESGSSVFPFQYTNGGKPYGVLIDFTALFQVPRTPEETEQFKKALPALNRFYSHPNTVVLKVTRFPEGYPRDPGHPYELPEGANTVNYTQRGWCYAESAMSGLVKDSSKVLDLNELPGNIALASVIMDCKSGREPPLSPDAFDMALNRKTFTSKKDDFERVAQLYRGAFTERIERATELEYATLDWDAGKARQLMEALRSNIVLQSLNLRGNSLGNEGADVVGQALRSNNTLQTLNLENNDIGAEGANFLGQALQLNSTLQTLNLSFNKIGAEGTTFLGEALEHNTSLKAVSLYWCGIGPMGTRGLAQALRGNGVLAQLDLGRNGIGPDGMVILAEALAANGHLTALNLGDGIDAGGVDTRQTVQAAASNPGMRQALDQRANHLGNKGASALVQALQRNSALAKLNIPPARDVSKEGLRLLQQAALARTVDLVIDSVD